MVKRKKKRKFPKGLTCRKGRLKTPYRDKKTGRMHYCKRR